ncbi:flagellar biosynthesis anti-sigma factor FlgM [Shewanella yunxiaonensis]|uniref:Negative regulator of flagellin synthesis n=1 Tax=Shewanella yunxiaonensis TaxID=2829809 RepID=A0ABX7YVW8_9GAMM|nr:MULTISPECIES: flagellar biosynthesis anti-sigma factor FlgM [Shewanella]MDF0532950.1 flagellar biosynthesis anti-sigma factor FlgM [Shewanella sp. A32]QUN06832.1 flagellar biosynthesis anti-sigma factor FlgM [Shewanella yunxiaonensis]
MDIKQLQNQPRVNTNSVTRSSGKAEQDTETSSVANNDDSVVVSAQAQQLQGMQSKIASMPDVDMKKVAEIKQAISEGRYKVDPEKLANNIAQFESNMVDLDQDS